MYPFQFVYAWRNEWNAYYLKKWVDLKLLGSPRALTARTRKAAFRPDHEVTKLKIVTELAASNCIRFCSAMPIERKRSDTCKLTRGRDNFIELVLEVHIRAILTHIVVSPNDADIKPNVRAGPIDLGGMRGCYGFLDWLRASDGRHRNC